MKKLLLVLFLLIATVGLVACSQKSTDNVDDFAQQVRDKGYIPIVVPVYEPKEKDGKVFIIEECYDDPSAGGYVTVAVNDHALKDCYINNITGVPTRLSAEEYDKCIAYYDNNGDYDYSLEISSSYKDINDDGYYEYIKVSNEDMEALIRNAGVDGKSSFKTALATGCIPTLSRDLVPHVVTMDDCTEYEEHSSTYLRANVSDYHVAIVPNEIEEMVIGEIVSYIEYEGKPIHYENNPLFYLNNFSSGVTIGAHRYLVAMDAPNITDLVNTSFYYCKVDANGFAIFDDFLLIDYLGDDKDIVIPDTITLIAGRSPSHTMFTDIESLTLPQGLVGITCKAFYLCSDLYEVRLPSGPLQHIDSQSFNYNTTLIFPENVSFLMYSLDNLYKCISEDNAVKEKIDVKIPDTKDKDRLVKYVESLGRKPIIVPVYEPTEKDGAAFIIERSFNDYFSGDYVTVAVNDLSLFDKYCDSACPIVLTPEEHDAIYNKLEALGKSTRILNKLDNYYILLNPNDPALSKADKEEMLNNFPALKNFEGGLYLFDTEATLRERTEMAEIIAETGYSPRSIKEKLSENKDLLEMYLDSGAIPTLKSNLVPYVLSLNDCEMTEDGYKATRSFGNVTVVPKEINGRPLKKLDIIGSIISLTIEDGCELEGVNTFTALAALDAPDDIKEKFAEEFSGIYLTLD